MAWYNQSWKFRKEITVDNTGGGALTNYQVQVDLTYNLHMLSDFSDIRFADSDGTTLLDHYRESYISSTSATFWVKIPSITGSSEYTIYVYYGNSSASSASSGSDTFDFFDDFSSDTINTKWLPVTFEQGDANLATISGGKLNCSITTASEASASAIYSVSDELTGDFDAYIDIVSFSADNGDYSAAEFWCDNSANDRVYVRLDKNASGQNAYASNIKINGVWGGYVYSNTSDTSGKLRIVRSGSTITTYYWNGSGWTQVKQTSGFTTEPMRCWVRSYSWDGFPDNVSVVWDNFVVVDDSSHSDDFDDNSIDDSKWFLNKVGQGSYPTESSQQLNTNAGASITSESYSMAVNRISSINGDFEAMMDFSSFSAPSENTSYVRMYFWVNDYDNIFVSLKRNSSGTTYTSVIEVAGSVVDTTSSGTTSDTSGRVKINRVGSVITAYYWNGSAWAELGSEESFSEDDAEIDIGVMSWDTFPDAVSASIDNIEVRKYSDPDPTASIGSEEPYSTSVSWSATVKEPHWLFEITLDGSESVDYYWSTKPDYYSDNTYDFKVMSFSPITIQMPDPELNLIPAIKTTVKSTFVGSVLDGNYASDFKLANIVIRLVLSTPDGAVEEKKAWSFIVTVATSVDQILTLQCQDWLTYYLEGDFPNTPLVSSKFPAKIMKDDNICVPVTFGTPYIPLRWVYGQIYATRVTDSSFILQYSGDFTAFFAADRVIIADCGVDGQKTCTVLSSNYAAGYTNVTLTGGSPAITANLTHIIGDSYCLGPATKTFTISEARTPREVNFVSIYDPGDYDITQVVLDTYDGDNYKAVVLIANDSNNDGTNDTNALWGIDEQNIHDVPFKFSDSATASITNPADIFDELLQLFGVPSSMIDSSSITSAASTYTSRGISMNVGLWYTMPRKKLLCKLLAMMNAIPDIGETIGLKVLTTSSQATISEDDVEPKSFSISKSYTQSLKDSGYVGWQDTTEPIDIINKSLVAVKSSTNNPSDITIDCEWIDGSDLAQRIAKLVLQRSILKDKTISFKHFSSILQYDPGDIITFDAANQGAEASSYDALIKKMIIPENLQIEVECDGFSDTLDDWGDTSASEITPADPDTSRTYSPIYQGPRDSVNLAGTRPNELTQNVLIGTNGEFKTNDDPATNGGFIATNQYLRCYNDNGDLRFEAAYSGGDDDGDVTIGDYSGDSGIKWDQSASELIIKVNSSGGIQVVGGGDITLTGSDSDPGLINFEGSSYSVQIGGNASGNYFVIKPTTNEATYFYVGGASWGDLDQNRFIATSLKSTDYFLLDALDSADDEAKITGYSNLSNVAPQIHIYLNDDDASETITYIMKTTSFYPDTTNYVDLGGSSDTWKDFHTQKIYTYDTSAPIKIAPNAGSSLPTHSANKGTLYVTSDGILCINTDGSTAWSTINLSSYGEFYWNNNSTATVIETADTPIMIRQTTTGLLSEWTYHQGSTGSITAFSDGSGTVNVASASHGLSTGDIISIRGTTNYNGIWEVTVIDVDNFSIPDTWVANDGASDWDQGDYLLAGSRAAGVYAAEYNLNFAESGPAGSEFHCHMYLNEVECPKCGSYITASNNEIHGLEGHSVISISAGDRLAITIHSDGTNSITVYTGNVRLHKISF